MPPYGASLLIEGTLHIEGSGLPSFEHSLVLPQCAEDFLPGLTCGSPFTLLAPLAIGSPFSKGWPRSPIRLPGAFSPAYDDSTLQPEAVLTVVLRADSEGAFVAKAGVHVFGLDEA